MEIFQFVKPYNYMYNITCNSCDCLTDVTVVASGGKAPTSDIVSHGFLWKMADLCKFLPSLTLGLKHNHKES